MQFVHKLTFIYSNEWPWNFSTHGQTAEEKYQEEDVSIPIYRACL